MLFVKSPSPPQPHRKSADWSKRSFFFVDMSDDKFHSKRIIIRFREESMNHKKKQILMTQLFRLNTDPKTGFGLTLKIINCALIPSRTAHLFIKLF